MSDVKVMKRHKGRGGWIIDFEQVGKVTKLAGREEDVPMEGVEAVMVAMADLGFAKLEGENS